jgi:hypothetical protein
MLEVQPELRAMLRTLHLSGMADNYSDLALKAAHVHLTYETYLAEVVQCECVLREQRRIARLLRHSGLPLEKRSARSSSIAFRWSSSSRWSTCAAGRSPPMPSTSWPRVNRV